ncbi:tail assembly protein [Bosea sp. (in: a-proteobacteria)]|uniref:tail assembly protein n=1 Tax=Bosea sp. (in: a-proteobacteria) TaxID=1871050 RepID=UPI0026345D40|nr:tail assembly protein [Bosea sp. (in: a-proteobacteria)]MCO5090879.1 tail assembly protein [Bosea sp. (in: a-proteobacteria)]
MLKRVHLYGEMAERFGPEFMLDVGSLRDVARALGVQLDGFRQYIAEGLFRVVAGPSLNDGIELGEDQIEFNVGNRDIHIVPVVKGAKRGGLGKVIAGVLLMAVAWWIAPALIPAGFMGSTGSLTILGFNANSVAMFGVAMALSGASQMLTPKQKKQQNTSPEEKPSFVFNSAVNTTEQGGCVPLIYGRVMVGSTVVSAGLSTDDVPV